MEQFKTIMEHRPEYRVVVCKEHRKGLTRLQLRTHLDNCHKSFTARTRKEIVKAAAGLQEWADNEEGVVYPARDSRPVRCLPVFEDGYQCTGIKSDGASCAFIRRQLTHIQKHCQEEHGWTNPRKRGRVPKGQRRVESKMWVEGVHCQKFDNTGVLGRLFQVAECSRSRENEEQTGDFKGEEERIASQQIQVALQTAATDLDKAEQEGNALIEADSNRFVPNPWLKRAGWAKHLRGLDRDWLSSLTLPAEKSERALAKICWAVELVIWRAQLASRTEVVGFAAMNDINRRVGGVSNSTEYPFNSGQLATTMIKYSRVWTQIISYVWRTHKLEAVKVRGLEEEEEEEGPGEQEGVKGKRPAYRLTPGQVRWLQKVESVVGRDAEESERSDAESSEEDMDEEVESRLESYVLSLMLALLDQELKDDEYRSVMVSASAVLGIDGERGWMGPFGYTPKLSAIVTVARMLVLYKSTKLRQERVADIMEKEGWEREVAEEKAPGHIELVQKMADRFTTLTPHGWAPTPMDWILRLRTYGLKVRFSSNADGVIEWMDDTLLYGHIKFSIPDLRSMVHGLVETTRIELQRDLLLLEVDEEGVITPESSQAPIIDWNELVDNPAEEKVGWSFTKDPRNAFGGVEGKEWLTGRMMREKRLRDGFIDIRATDVTVPDGRGVAWKTERVRKYGLAMRTFRQHLLVLAHMTGGLPARGSEIVTVQHSNSANGEARGLFIENGLVVYVTRYHKGIGASGKAKVIHRYLPREVGELVVYYLWLVLPFWQRLQRACYGGSVGEGSPFIWQPEQETRWEKPQRRKRKRVEEGEEDEEENVEGGDNEGAEQGSAMEAAEKWNTSRVGSAIRRVSLQWLGVKMTILAWRHSSKAIYRRYINDKAVMKAVVEGDEEEEGGEDEAFDLQTGHGSRIGGGIYGRTMDESPFSTEAQRAALRRVSTEWHRFLLFKSTLEAAPKRGSRAAAERKEVLAEQLRSWKRMAAIDIDEQLRRLVGEEAQFRGVQRPALQAIMRQKSPVVAIMGTGAGKSVLFMLPAMCSTGVTVVVVPLVSLRQDMKARCDKAGIECVEWDSRKPHEWARVMLVTPESVVSESFRMWINRQQAMARLNTIVIDECHVVLDSRSGWRTQMLALRELVQVETQLVYLTATMRPSEELEFIRLYGLPAKEECQWFRGGTTRKNVRYQVRSYEAEEEEEAIKKLVEEKKREYAMPGQIIVYCDTVEKTVRLAGVLGCVCFHRNVGSRQEKRELVRQLTEGRQQVFTATNALGLGIDAPTIRVVIHMGMVRMMRQYAQESGRAGRDGLKSEAIIMRAVRRDRRGGVLEERFGEEVEEEMQEFSRSEGCMRVVMDRAMDGRVDRTGCEEDEEKCDRCRGEEAEEVGTEMETAIEEVEDGGEETLVEVGTEMDMEMEKGIDMDMEEEVEFEQERTVRRRKAREEAGSQSTEALEVDRLTELLEEWKVGCQRCRVWEVRCEDHKLSECGAEKSEDVRQGVGEMKKMVKWERYSCCWECGVPQEVCASWEKKVQGGWGKRKGRECQYKETLLEAVFANWVRYTEEFGWCIEEQMIGDGWKQGKKVSFEEMVRWMAKKVRWGGIESTQLCRVFPRFIEVLRCGDI